MVAQIGDGTSGAMAEEILGSMTHFTTIASMAGAVADAALGSTLTMELDSTTAITKVFTMASITAIKQDSMATNGAGAVLKSITMMESTEGAERLRPTDRDVALLEQSTGRSFAPRM